MTSHRHDCNTCDGYLCHCPKKRILLIRNSLELYPRVIASVQLT